jgi:hypothetical protein
LTLEKQKIAHGTTRRASPSPALTPPAPTKKKMRKEKGRRGEEGRHWPTDPLWASELRKEKGRGGGSPLASHHLVPRPCTLPLALVPPTHTKKKMR